jgi:hypothetical protein
MFVARCPECHSPKIKVTKPGLVWNSLICEVCEHPFKRLSPASIATAGALDLLRRELGGVFDDVKRAFSDPTPEARAPLPARQPPARPHPAPPGHGQSLLKPIVDERGISNPHNVGWRVGWRVWRLDRPGDHRYTYYFASETEHEARACTAMNLRDDRYRRADFAGCVRERISSEVLRESASRLDGERVRRMRELRPDLYGPRRAP